MTERFSTVQRVRFGDLDAMQPLGYDYAAGESRPVPDVLRERIEPQIPAASAPDAVG
jgi:hypothetical protein